MPRPRTHSWDGPHGGPGTNHQAIARRTDRFAMPKERTVLNNVILLHELADDRTRERLAAAERRRLTSGAGEARRAPATGGARRAVGRALIRVGARLDGERWEPAATLPSGMLKAAR